MILCSSSVHAPLVDEGAAPLLSKRLTLHQGAKRSSLALARNPIRAFTSGNRTVAEVSGRGWKPGVSESADVSFQVIGRSAHFGGARGIFSNECRLTTAHAWRLIVLSSIITLSASFISRSNTPIRSFSVPSLILTSSPRWKC